MNMNCKDCGDIAPHPNTVYQSVKELIVAGLHHLKVLVIGLTHASQIVDANVERGYIPAEDPETVWVHMGLHNFRRGYKRARSASTRNEHATNKHRVVWIISLDDIQKSRRRFERTFAQDGSYVRMSAVKPRKLLEQAESMLRTPPGQRAASISCSPRPCRPVPSR